MGYIICDIHGENVVSFVSEYHAKKVNEMEKCIESEIIHVEVVDKKKLFNGSYIVDSILVNDIGVNELKIDVEMELEKYEMMFSKLSPVCPKCLDNYLKGVL